MCYIYGVDKICTQEMGNFHEVRLNRSHVIKSQILWDHIFQILPFPINSPELVHLNWVRKRIVTNGESWAYEYDDVKGVQESSEWG